MPFGVPARHTAIKFLEIQFQGDWLRMWPIHGVMYTVSSAKAEILVVTDPEFAPAMTYVFAVPKGEEVWIDRNIIHIPAICIKQIEGNGIRCQGT
ncbi:MAG: hypothetical protein DMF58_13605 [Acidobacteria bacterium]|nr:MAG: hypothetical protein DMF58_13605 [Acidobacteriota bacterium]